MDRIVERRKEIAFIIYSLDLLFFLISVLFVKVIYSITYSDSKTKYLLPIISHFPAISNVSYFSRSYIIGNVKKLRKLRNASYAATFDIRVPRYFCVNGTVGTAIALKQFYGTILIGSRRPMCGLHKLLFSRYTYELYKCVLIYDLND